MQAPIAVGTRRRFVAFGEGPHQRDEIGAFAGHMTGMRPAIVGRS